MLVPGQPKSLAGRHIIKNKNQAMVAMASNLCLNYRQGHTRKGRGLFMSWVEGKRDGSVSMDSCHSTYNMRVAPQTIVTLKRPTRLVNRVFEGFLPVPDVS